MAARLEEHARHPVRTDDTLVDLVARRDRLAADQALFHAHRAPLAAADVAAGLEDGVAFALRAEQAFVERGGGGGCQCVEREAG